MIQIRREILALSDEERNAIRENFQAQLEEEHRIREERALRKQQRATVSTESTPKQKRSEINALKSQMRKDFYQKKGYSMEKDPTGRNMWLSPTEQNNRKRKRKGRRKNKFKTMLQPHLQSIILYLSIMVFAVILGLIIAK